jgi:hypothetical protein
VDWIIPGRGSLIRVGYATRLGANQRDQRLVDTRQSLGIHCNERWREQRNGYPDEVIDDLVTVLERDDCHYEAMLGYLETQFRRRGPHSAKYHGLYSWLVELVSVLLTIRHTQNLEQIKRLPPRYERHQIARRHKYTAMGVFAQPRSND